MINILLKKLTGTGLILMMLVVDMVVLVGITILKVVTRKL